MAKPSFAQETQPQPRNNNLPSTSTNSNLIGSFDVVSSQSFTNYNMDHSCFSKAILDQTSCSVNFTQRRSLEDQERHRSWFECETEETTMSTIHLLSQVKDQHFMFKVDDHVELDGIFDIVKDLTITLHDEGYGDLYWQ